MATVDINPPAAGLPSRYRVEPGSCDIPLGTFPPTSSTTPENPDQIASALVEKLNAALDSKNGSELSALFIENSYWRDHLCLSWDFRSLKGREAISKYVGESASAVKIEIDRSSPRRAPHNGPIDAFGDVHGIEFFVKVTTNVGHGNGIVRLAQLGDEWKIFTVSTSLQDLTGYEEAVSSHRPVGVQHGARQGRKNWQDRRNADINYEDNEPAVIIVGAGQGGLTAAARLKAFNVDTLVIDHEDRIGDSWRRRYHQLVLHDPVWFDHMPYIPFPPTWPVFTPKDKLAEFFESYVKLLELNVWTRTELQSSCWDEGTKQWTVALQRTKEDGTTETRTLHPRHVIQATGHSGKKNAPTFKGAENFQGDRICHSSEFPGANPNSRGKKAVVVGSCNSGHDIAQDYYEKGYEVTMVQRSSTCVASSKSVTDIALKGLYEEAGPPTEDADTYLWSIPSELFKAQQVKISDAVQANDAKTIEGLEKAGFKVDRGPRDAGLLIKYFQRGGGYYIDVGGSQLIIDGKVQVKQGQEIREILPHGIKFADGSELEADEIILATGYQNMRTQARIIFGDSVADRVGDVWGLDQEGEFRTIWRRSGHPGFWFMGGNLALCRYYSRLLALQIKALEVGIATY
ncbi:uncharacterized protein N7459_005727 [Penicillium hispanicum]|uniref:uncharacterized protein n=1 Tax=Penicillium hispanicum TaxID=1080232 RepID=UPI0025408B8D|nr:uncharacterized protein N7459_005727 [Penicillium hispanicum]KAJ5579742.1 hypothetical protein N7459_005727 [Penicillium hispanicum]